MAANGESIRKIVSEMRLDLSYLSDGFAKLVHEMKRMNRRFDTFLMRFDEVTEMLVESDTEQLCRIAAVEKRLDDIEGRIPPAA